jgi:hypothetical protein
VINLCKRHCVFQVCWHMKQISCWRRLLQNWKQNGSQIVYNGWESGVGSGPKNPCFLWKAHSAQWDTFVWLWYVNDLSCVFMLEIFTDSCYFRPHTPTQLWFLGILYWNTSGVIGLVCHLLLIIENFWRQHKKFTNSPELSHMFEGL